MGYEGEEQETIDSFTEPDTDTLSIKEATRKAMGIAEPYRDKRAPTTDASIFIHTVAMLLGLRHREQSLEWFELLIP